LALVMVVLVAPAACARSSETRQVASDPADETVPGNLPTAPARGDGTEGLGAGANRLLAELEEIQQERDLCAVLTGSAFEGLVGQNIDPSALVTNPAGITRLVTALDSTFVHMVSIAPPDLVPAMQTLRDVWRRLASLGPVADAESQANVILSEPEVQASNQAIILWTATNCAGVALPTPAPPATP
jgi:hypothetical protein